MTDSMRNECKVKCDESMDGGDASCLVSCEILPDCEVLEVNVDDLITGMWDDAVERDIGNEELQIADTRGGAEPSEPVNISPPLTDSEKYELWLNGGPTPASDGTDGTGGTDGPGSELFCCCERANSGF